MKEQIRKRFRLMGMRRSLRSWMALLPFAAIAPVPCRANSDVAMLGPMIHYNFGWHGDAFSFGLEGSYWPDDLAPWGMDAGIEFDLRGRARLYAEAEAGNYVTGGALGPCVEIGDGRMRAGVQGSAWANALLGADFRMRALWGDDPEFAPGVYFKYPVVRPHPDNPW